MILLSHWSVLTPGYYSLEKCHLSEFVLKPSEGDITVTPALLLSSGLYTAPEGLGGKGNNLKHTQKLNYGFNLSHDILSPPSIALKRMLCWREY